MVLWTLATLFVLPLVGGAIGLALHGREELGRGRRASALLCFAGAALGGLVWAAALGYCGLRAVRAIP